MNVFILTDLEGIPGVTDIEFMERKSSKYILACKYLTDTLNLAIKCCFENKADNVYYLDGHGGGGNINPEAVDERAVKCSISEWQELLRTGKIDVQIELGAHARAGTLCGFLDHTLTSKEWFSHKVNGKEMSELSLHALLCSQYNVPIIACIGDETACEQAKEYIPEICIGAVKKASKRNLAIDYPNSEEIITKTIKNALLSYKNIGFYNTNFPAVVELTFYRTDMCDSVFENCDVNVERVDARTLRKVINKLEIYEDLKF